MRQPIACIKQERTWKNQCQRNRYLRLYTEISTRQISDLIPNYNQQRINHYFSSKQRMTFRSSTSAGVLESMVTLQIF